LSDGLGETGEKCVGYDENGSRKTKIKDLEVSSTLWVVELCSDE